MYVRAEQIESYDLGYPKPELSWKNKAIDFHWLRTESVACLVFFSILSLFPIWDFIIFWLARVWFTKNLSCLVTGVKTLGSNTTAMLYKEKISSNLSWDERRKVSSVLILRWIRTFVLKRNEGSKLNHIFQNGKTYIEHIIPWYAHHKCNNLPVKQKLLKGECKQKCLALWEEKLSYSSAVAILKWGLVRLARSI